MTMHTGMNLILVKQRRPTLHSNKVVVSVAGARIRTVTKHCLIAIYDHIIETLYHGEKPFIYGVLRN